MHVHSERGNRTALLSACFFRWLCPVPGFPGPVPDAGRVPSCPRSGQERRAWEAAVAARPELAADAWLGVLDSGRITLEVVGLRTCLGMLSLSLPSSTGARVGVPDNFPAEGLGEPHVLVVGITISTSSPWSAEHPIRPGRHGTCPRLRRP